jgi:hypothetical protein
MTRVSLRTAFTALALGVAALGAATLTASEASAKGFHGGGWGHHGGGGWGKHHGFHGGGGWGFHGGWGHHGGGWGKHHGFHGGYGLRRIGFYAPVVYGGYGYGCTVRKFLTEDGDVIIKKRCS